jgi:signal transduction histidine kinase
VSIDLRSVPLFGSLPADDLERLESACRIDRLASGETLFSEGDDPDLAYVIDSGELEILKESAGRNVRIAVSGPGDVVGEMGLLTGEPRNATARALDDATLVSIPRAALDELLSTSAAASRALFDVFIARWREQESRVRQSERMAQIGVLTAGLAHEMNNPAAAVASGAETLETVLNTRDASVARLGEVPIPVPSSSAPQGTMERADVEDEVEGALERIGVDEPWRHAAVLVQAGFIADDLPISGGPDAIAAVEVAAFDAEAAELLAEVAEGARRLSELVNALKSYSFLDQAPVQEVDVIKGIDDTLLILRSKMKGITVEREYAEDVPLIVAYGSQLNQVWTNLLDNAADAINEAGFDGGKVIIRVDERDGCVVVEVENNGPPIPPEVADRIFEAFFTTKAPGKGTGLGLDTAYSIVVNQHRGSLTVKSDDDGTVFTVVLPASQDAATI